MTATGEVTRLLREYSGGSREQLDELVPLVYDDLRRIAHRQLRAESAGHTLDTTELVHEAYVNLVNRQAVEWRDRAHFFALASRVIRHILVDHARRKKAEKRGGGAVHVSLGQAPRTPARSHLELLALEDALEELEERDPRLVQVVEQRIFGGMSVEETAEVLDVSGRTVNRDWKRAKAYLRRSLAPEADR